MALVPQPADDAFREGILYRLARHGIMPVNLEFLRPLENRVTGQLDAVIRDDQDKPATQRDHPLEFSGHPNP